MQPAVRALVTLAALSVACSGSGSDTADSLGSADGGSPDADSAGRSRDARPPDGLDPLPVDAPLDGGLGDAGSDDAGAGEAAALVAEPDRLTVTAPDQAALDALWTLTGEPISDAERGAPGATRFAQLPAGGDPDAPLPAEAHGGRTGWLRVTWGFLNGLQIPDVPAWHDFSGSIAISGGELSLLAAGSAPGPSEPTSAPSQSDVVAAQTDPRVLRFSTQVGSGTAGLVVLLTRPSLAPSVVAVTVSGTTHLLPFERFLRDGAEGGGWDIPIGQVGFDTRIIRSTPACYAAIAKLTGRVSYGAGNDSPVSSLTGTLTPDAGPGEPLALAADGAPVGPYGVLRGSVAAGELAAYYGREWQFRTFSDRGSFIGALPSGQPDAPLSLLLGSYDGTIAFSGARAVQQVECSSPGASHDTPFVF